MTKLDSRYKFAYVVSTQKTETETLLMIAGYVISLGFFFGTVENNLNYSFIFDVATSFIWGCLFCIYSCFKFLTISTKFPSNYSLCNSMFGLWMWLFIFLSFAVYDVTPIAPTEWLLLMPVISEIIVAANILIKRC